MIGRVEGLKRKVGWYFVPLSGRSFRIWDQLSDLQTTAGSPTLDVMRERCKHLAITEDIQSSKDPEYIRWVDTRLDRWIVDWVLHRGRDQTARHIAQEKDIEVSPTRLIFVGCGTQS
jgi:macrophage erythroblast attacher